MPRKPLRVVAADEKPAQKRTHTVSSAASEGSRRDLLVAIRDRVAKAVQDESTPPRDLASLSKRLTDIAREIEALDARAAEEGDADAEHGDVDAHFDASAI